MPHVRETTSGEEVHLPVELEVPGIDDRQAARLQNAKSEGRERLEDGDAVGVVGRVGHDGVDGLVTQVGEHLSEVPGAKLPCVADVLRWP